MPDLKFIYNHQADQYQRLVAQEDYQENLLPAIQRICPVEGLDIVDTGAGTGRLTCLLAPLARSITAFDLSAHMLQVTQTRLETYGFRHTHTAVADHRSLPIACAKADLVISGWSVCYTYLENGVGWSNALAQTISGFHRILRPGGRIILIETLGTGFEQPQRIPILSEYLDWLEENGFQMNWVRTDYRFDNSHQARELIPFFFGEAMLNNLRDHILPECTGLWWQ
ncbi:MAG: class I SAM-dependent methyltransferase [Anaerolineales bacterium]|nr:class I SAM-dependent methyltransferase [Anaerolineales bacterium]